MSRSKQTRAGCLGLVSLILAIMLLPFVWQTLVQKQNEERIFDANSAPPRPVAIVYGAAIFRGDRLSSILRDRMDTAIQLYEIGVVDTILVSGDRQDDSYDEPGTMAEYAHARGIPTGDIIIDEAGNRTYDTCYRALHIFDFESAILVTQDFHLPRALFTCNQLGLESIGVTADRRAYRGAEWYDFREMAATMVALFDILQQNPPAITTATSAQ